MTAKRKLTRAAALFLALLMMISIIPMSAFAADAPEALELKNGTAVISAEMTEEQVQQAIFNALVANPEGKNPADYQWEYYCKGTLSTGLVKRSDWGSVNGFTSYVKFGITYKYYHPALKDNSNGEYKVRVAGQTAEVTLTKKSTYDVTYDYDAARGNILVDGKAVTTGNVAPGKALSFTVVPNEGFKVVSVTANGKELIAAEGVYTIDAVNEDTVIAATFAMDKHIPFTLTFDAAQGVTVKVNGAAVENGQAVVYADELTTVSFVPDENTSVSKVTLGGEDITAKTAFENYVGTYTFYAEQDNTISAEGVKTAVALSGNTEVDVAADANGNWDYNAIAKNIIDVTVDKNASVPADMSNFSVTYFAGKDLFGTKEYYEELDFIPDSILNATLKSFKDVAEKKIKLTYLGDEQYRPSAPVYVVITLGDLPTAKLEVKGGQTFTLYVKDDLTYDYDRLRQEIFDTVINKETMYPSTLTWKDVQFSYDSMGGAAESFQPFEARKLDGDAAETARIYMHKAFKPTAFNDPDYTKTILITVPSTDSYYGNSVKFSITVNNVAREESKVVLKEGVAIKYNRDYEAMKNDIFNNVIDWEKSTLPAKETLTKDSFTFTYYGHDVLAGGTAGAIKRWVPFEGETVIGMANFAPIGAGEQQIRVSFNGNSTHNGCDAAETAITVNKATTRVTVHSTNKYFDEKIPADFVTTSVNDDFEIYTIFVGVSSDVAATIYIDLPGTISESQWLKIFDPIFQLVLGRTGEDVMKNGLTIGELKNLIHAEELINVLKFFNIDTSALETVVKILNNLPSSVEKIKIGIDEPYTAGLYTAVAIATNPNYETGVGVGSLLVKMRSTGTKLYFNQTAENKKIAASEAANFDFSAMLTRDGVKVESKNIRYIYTGIKANGMPYVDFTNPPKEPGRYVQTAYTFGGSYYAFPVTRSFQITNN